MRAEFEERTTCVKDSPQLWSEDSGSNCQFEIFRNNKEKGGRLRQKKAEDIMFQVWNGYDSEKGRGNEFVYMLGLEKSEDAERGKGGCETVR